MPEFRVVTGYGRSFNYKITGDVITIGRSKDNHVVLFDHTASRRHAKVRKTPDGYLLMDLDSHNGTHVNGKSRAFTVYEVLDDGQGGNGAC
jgi:two-component system, NtrC family, sensor kinase